jgi:hypothetical protein
MKISALISIAALACSTAFAAQYNSGSADGDPAANRTHSAAVSNDSQPNGAKGGGLVEKTKRAFHRMGQKLREATHRTTSASRNSSDRDEINAAAERHDTRSMGAAGSDTQDSARQRRMDQAYNDWRANHK